MRETLLAFIKATQEVALEHRLMIEVAPVGKYPRLRFGWGCSPIADRVGYASGTDDEQDEFTNEEAVDKFLKQVGESKS